MLKWGWTSPVLVDECDMIIAGHGRILAAQKLGLTDAPVMIARGWTDAEKRAYVIADNKLALNAGWDMEKLTVEIGDLSGMGFNLTLTGFSEGELGKMAGTGTEGLTDPDKAPETPARAVTVPGDVWIMGKHRLRCGDSTVATDVEALLAGVRPHLMVTDPPYGVEYDPASRGKAAVNKNDGKGKLGKVENDNRADWREAWALFRGDVAYVWHAALHAGVVADSLAATGFALRAQIVWVKDRFALSRGDYHWQHEPCWYAVRGKGHWAGDRKQATVWEIKSREDKGFGHGAQKLVDCMKRPIENNSSPGQAVYEPFSGSGTTLIAGEMTGRCVYAMELNPGYVDVALLRWQAFTGEKAVLEGTGRTFEDTAADRYSPAKDGEGSYTDAIAAGRKELTDARSQAAS